MILALPLLVALATAAPPEVRAVRVTTLDLRAALRVLTGEDVPAGAVVREGGEVVIRVPAAAPEGLALPALEPPLEAIRIERAPGLTVLRVRVAPEVPFEATHEAGMLTVVFGEQPAPGLRGPVTAALYSQLFPTGAQGSLRGEDEEAPAFDESREGIGLGPLTLRPYLSASWVDADVLAFDSPVPVRDQYLQLAPGVTASLPLLDGVLAAEYEPRFRFFSDLPQVGETSHVAGIRLELPLGSRTVLRVGDRFTRAVLETSVVDPGREYFFDLTPFTFNEVTVAARVDLGPRLFAEGDFANRNVSFDSTQGGFFGYAGRTARAGLGYDLGGDLRAVLSYSFERIPPSPDRALVETSAHSVFGTLSGPIGALMSGTLSAGYRHQANPLASGASASYDGLTLGGSLRRDLGHSSVLELQLNRAADPSGFEENAYYVTNSALLSLTVPAPWDTWLRGSAGYLRNGYPNDAAALGEPRRDEIVGWTVGAGKQLGWRAWLRADYRHERRDSNLPGYDVTTDGFVVQLGLGLFGPGGAARP